MFSGNVRMAIASIRSTKWRSFLTTLGIIIGIVSVVTTVSIGEGIKQQVAGQINHYGHDLITVRPGKVAPSSTIANINVNAVATASTLTDKDIDELHKSTGIKYAVPFNVVTAVATTDDQRFDNGQIIGTTEDLPQVLNQKILYGDFFLAGDANKHVAVIGKQVAEQLFQETVPVGRTFTIHGQDFIVRGVFDDFMTNPLDAGKDFNSAIFIPYNIAKQISSNNAQIYQILIKPDTSENVQQAITTVKSVLSRSHNNEDDFSVLKPEESLAIANNILNLITRLIAGIAAISLLVGGIGIMNIMLVAVSERTHEIGIRKAIGASNAQILSQFLTEAVVLSTMGGILGVIFSLVANFVLNITTPLRPVITWPIMLVAVTVSVVVGIIFGVAPALKAARQDPIEALRHG